MADSPPLAGANTAQLRGEFKNHSFEKKGNSSLMPGVRKVMESSYFFLNCVPFLLHSATIFSSIMFLEEKKLLLFSRGHLSNITEHSAL